MSRRIFRLVRRAFAEALLFGFGLGCACALELHRGPSVYSAACLALGLFGAGVGLAVRARAGELKLAWSCPRLDAMGLRPGSANAPWAVLAAAEGALEALGPAERRYRSFFPGARRDLLHAARRAVQAHGANAPDELARLTRLLCDIRRRLVEATFVTGPDESPVLALEALEERCGALAEAVTQPEQRATA